jgi:MoxR-like ATPase
VTTHDTTKEVPTELPQCWQDFHDVINAGVNRLVLLGQPGIGKTYGALTYGKDGATPNALRLLCTPDMTLLEVIGGFMPNESGGFTYFEGTALTAWRTGARLIIDEADQASGDVLSALLMFCDSTDSSRFIHPVSGEVITPHPEFSAIITSNAESKAELPNALADRFPVAITIDQPHPEALRSLPQDVWPLALALTTASPENRASLRAVAEFVRLREAFGAERAGSLVFEPHIVESIREAELIARAV